MEIRKRKKYPIIEKVSDKSSEENEDLKQLLLATRNALLKKSARRKPAEPDYLLMKIRGELNNR